MLRQSLHELVIHTVGRGFHEFTSEVAALVRGANLQKGLVTLHLLHTSASLLIQENAARERASADLTAAEIRRLEPWRRYPE